MIADAHPPAIHDLPRQCRRHDGLPKRAFGCKGQAQWYIRKVLGDESRPYQCSACDYWHISSKREAA